MDLGSSTTRLLLFLPGFVTPADAYQQLLAPLAGPGLRVVAPKLYGPRPGVLLGRYKVRDEARDAERLVHRLQTAEGPQQLWLAGHSRGGHSAWLAASGLANTGTPVAGLILLDPVKNGTLQPLGTPELFAHPPLIIGAGLGGRCAPANRNHQQFANVCRDAIHVRIPDMGHADMLDGRAQRLGRGLCTGGPHPEQVRALTSKLMDRYLAGTLAPESTLPAGVERV